MTDMIKHTPLLMKIITPKEILIVEKNGTDVVAIMRGEIDYSNSIIRACNAHDDLVAALKYAHSQMQPFCDDTIVKQALEKAGVE